MFTTVSSNYLPTKISIESRLPRPLEHETPFRFTRFREASYGHNLPIFNENAKDFVEGTLNADISSFFAFFKNTSSQAPSWTWAADLAGTTGGMQAVPRHRRCGSVW